MSKIRGPKVRFLSLSSLQTSRGGLLLAESALVTLPSLLFAANEEVIPVRHCFFFLSARFATSLTFSFVLSPHLFSSSARSLGPAEPFHQLQRVARRSPAEARRIDSRPHPQVGARLALMPNLPSTLASPRGPSFKSRADGQAVVSSRRNCDIKE